MKKLLILLKIQLCSEIYKFFDEKADLANLIAVVARLGMSKLIR